MLDIKKIRQELEEMDLLNVGGGMGGNRTHVNEDRDFPTNAEALEYGNKHVQEVCQKYNRRPTFFYVTQIASKRFRTSFYVQM